MFNRKKIKELNIVADKLREVVDYQHKLIDDKDKSIKALTVALYCLREKYPEFICIDCKTKNVPDYEVQSVNQSEKIRVVAVCKNCGSKQLMKEEKV